MAGTRVFDHDVIDMPLEVKAEGEPGSFEGYGAIFGNLDRDGDIVVRGAFADSLKKRMPALLWQHNAKEPIGRFDIVREDEKGLFVKGRLSMEGRGREAYELLKMGALDGLSIGFVTKEASRNELTGARTIRKADLMEVSLVTFPANELARISGVKSAADLPESPRTFERFLRENGFSRSRAKAITAKGFGAREDRCGQAIGAVIADLKDRREQLETVVGSDCHSDCIDCEPCRKSRNYQTTCDTLRNDIRDGNRSRWRAWKKLDKALRNLDAKVKAFTRKYDINLAVSSVSTAINTVRAVVTRKPDDIASAAVSAYDLVESLINYNQKYKDEYEREVGPWVRAVAKAKRDAANLDSMFWKQVRAFERGNCGTLSSSDFNRP